MKLKNYLKQVLSSLSLLLACFSTQAQWATLGTQGFSDGRSTLIRVAVNSNMPYVAYSDGGNGGKATVMTFNGSDWASVGTKGISNQGGGFPQIVFDNNKPYVMYIDADKQSRATVMSYSGTAWTPVGNEGFSDSEIEFPSIDMFNSTPYVAYVESGKLTTMKFNGSSWEPVGSKGFANAEIVQIKVNNGIPYVAFLYSWSLSLMKFNGTTWELVGEAEFNKTTTGQFELAFLNSTPYVFFSDDNSSAYGAYVMKFNGSSWEKVGGPVTDNRIFNPSMVISNGVPYIAYADIKNDFKAIVKKFDGNAWVSVGVEGVSEGEASWTSIATDANSNIYLAYGDGTRSPSRATVMKYTNLTTSLEADLTQKVDGIIYPNPTSDKLFLNEKSTLDSYVLFNAFGIEINKGTIFENTIDLAYLENGVYHLQLSEKGTTTRIKFIKL